MNQAQQDREFENGVVNNIMTSTDPDFLKKKFDETSVGRSS